MKYEEIESLLAQGKSSAARTEIERLLASDGDNAHLLFLHGKSFMKESRWGEAISCFLKAEAIEPGGPTREAREMLCDILDFYNKDMYNQ